MFVPFFISHFTKRFWRIRYYFFVIGHHHHRKCHGGVEAILVFKRGVNVPSLDTIVEVTPIGFHEQYYGRIRRLYPNKKNPLHVSIRDVGIECLESLQNAKVAQTKKCAYAEIISGRLGDIAQ